MENLLTIIFSGVVVTILTAVFNRVHWNGNVKFGISVLATLLFGGIGQYGAIKAGWQQLDGTMILGALAGVFTAAQGFFRLFPDTVTAIETDINGEKKPMNREVGELVDGAVAAALPYITRKIEEKLSGNQPAPQPTAAPAESTQYGGVTIPANPIEGTIYDNPVAPVITQVQVSEGDLYEPVAG